MKTLIITLLTLTVTTVSGQSFEPLELAKRIFGKDSLPHIEIYSTGEYKGSPNGQDLQPGSTTKFALLGQTEKTAVVGMTILDITGNGLDTYLHFKKDTIWKMSAFRTLAMTGMLEEVKVELESMTPQQVDKIIAKSKNNKKGNLSIFTSREEYNFQLGNARLTLELDENIEKHFFANQAEFERIKNIALAELGKKMAEDERQIKLVENLKKDYQKLFITSVSTGGYELGNCLNFLIGGMIDNSVGYIYVKDRKDLPEMNADRIIMLKEIGNGWYIYKTT